MDENDITDDELAEMWHEATPIALEHRSSVNSWVVSHCSQTLSVAETAFTLHRGLGLSAQQHAANRPATTAS